MGALAACIARSGAACTRQPAWAGTSAGKVLLSLVLGVQGNEQDDEIEGLCICS
jgi:hypothetical protein